MPTSNYDDPNWDIKFDHIDIENRTVHFDDGSVLDTKLETDLRVTYPYKTQKGRVGYMIRTTKYNPKKPMLSFVDFFEPGHECKKFMMRRIPFINEVAHRKVTSDDPKYGELVI